MGILKAIGDFLFGKNPDIFDEKGRVRHKFTEEKWQAWDARISKSNEYDWHDHTGEHLGIGGPTQRAKQEKAKQGSNPTTSKNR